MSLTRRGFLASSIPAGLWAAGLSAQTTPVSARFRHGVASGDPETDSVILWTRVEPTSPDERVHGEWVVARDRALRDVVQAGSFTTGAERDWTVKIDAGGLDADAWYWYGFRVGNNESAVGRTRTLPAGRTDRLRLAVFSCSNLPFGYFNSYASAAARDDLDLAVHLGDYIYEYEARSYGSTGARLGRISDPTHEILDLADYRRRYAQYRSEPELQAIHAALPMVVVWDDHEIANNTWHSGAENHDPVTEGSFADRREAAIRAFHEWLPIRSRPASSRDRIYRTLQLGDLASLVMLDTRLIGRDQQIDYSQVASFDRSSAESLMQRIHEPQRSMLGARQEAWLKNELARSKSAGVPWQILGQQLLLGTLTTPRSSDTLLRQDPERQARLDFMSGNGLPLNLDAWDGYEPARQRLAQDALAFANNVVALAGDTHNSWAFDLHDPSGRQYGVELGTTSVTSPGLEGSFDPAVLVTRLQDRNPDLRFANLRDRGYMTLTVDRDSIETEWLYVDTVESRTFSERSGGRAILEARRGAGTAPLQIS